MAKGSLTETELEDQKARVEDIIVRIGSTLKPLGVELSTQELSALLHQELSTRLKKITLEALSHLSNADLKIAIDLHDK